MNTELITKYIHGELSAGEKAAFEARLASDSAFKKEYDQQVQILEGIKRLGLKNQWASAFRKVKARRLITKAVIVLALTLAVLGTILIVRNRSQQAPDGIRHELNENGEANWSQADRSLESQLFRIDPDRDTVIETRQGIVIAIPAASFEHSSGEGVTGTFELELKEALSAAEIMKAGLSTMSNGSLLETNGMFYLNARQGSENLKVNRNKPLNVNVPVNNDKNDMMLFRGERLADGSINWVDPKPMKRRLTTVDILGLYFYPEHFLDTLQALGFDITNKTKTDSVYYSLGGCMGYAASSDSLASSFGTATGLARPGQKPDGARVFRQNCAVCHSMGKEKLTGPGLEGVLERVPSLSWMKQFIRNNYTLIKNGDAYANKIYNENGKAAMPAFYLSDAEMNALIKYITGKAPVLVEERFSSECPEIDPSRIRAIWDRQFNHTILATKAFEERLKVIFKTCDARLLSLYINNLDQDLCDLDSVAATLSEGALSNAFREFAKRKDGGVEIGNTKNRMLQRYFAKKQALYDRAVSTTLEQMREKEDKLAQEAFEKRGKHAKEEAARSAKVYSEELQVNIREAYRQIGEERPFFTPSDNYASADLVQTGWHNLDRYVMESTANRSTLQYSDPASGKKAIIRYEPVSVEIVDAASYDRIVCYMIPDKLSSFQLLKPESALFKEKLNELMNYSLVTVGFKGRETFYHDIKNAKATSYKIRLISIDGKSLDETLNSAFPLNLQKDLLKDIRFQQFDLSDIKRQERILEREAIRNRLIPVVFPCKVFVPQLGLM